LTSVRQADGYPAFASGWYGKIPLAGDFVARRVPGTFCDAWSHWLHDALDSARTSLAGQWPEDFLSMPVWRFVLAPGLVTPSAWAGVMAPSVDSVGRFFPLALASALPARPLDLVATAYAARPWFDAMEQVAFSAIGADADVAVLDAATAARPFPGELLRSPGEDAHDPVPQGVHCVVLSQSRASTPQAAWLAEASEIFGCTLLLGEALPSAEAFCAMMDGRWVERGWMPSEMR
jgi:type VI secretion system protein ImpM